MAAAVAGGSTGATALATNAVGTSTNSGTWNSTSTIERSVTFGSSAIMRAFFNGGGSIRIDPTCVTGIDGDKDTVFNDLTVTAIGNLDIGALTSTRSGSGETLSTDGLALGFHDLTTSYQTIIKLTSDNSGYTSNTVEIFAKLNAAPGSATVVTIKMVSTDAADDTTFTSGNTSGVDQYANFIGQTDFSLHTVNPTTAQGLASVASISASAIASNTTA